MSSLLDSAIAALEAYFTHVVVEPAADDPCDDLLDDGEAITEIPRGLRQYLTRCDGIMINTHDLVEGELFGSDVMMGWQGSHTEVTQLKSIVLPLRSDGCGNYDVVLCDGPAAGGVFFLETVTGTLDVIIASDVPHYVKMWADHLIASHERDGSRRPHTSRPYFDEGWLRKHDPAALMMRTVSRTLPYCRFDDG